MLGAVCVARPLRSSEAPNGLLDLTEAESQRVGLANEMYDWSWETFISCTLRGIMASIEPTQFICLSHIVLQESP